MDRRALNRATLDRQMLLRRWEMPTTEAVEKLVGLQSQTATTWYQGLWCRLEGFQPEQVAELIVERELVRIVLMRSTIHLVTARDCGRLRPLMQPVLDRGLTGAFGRNLAGLDAEEVIAAGRKLVEQKPRTVGEIGKLLRQRWPDRDAFSLGLAVRAWVPLVQVPPRGIWGASGPAAHTTVESWLGQPMTSDYTLDDLMLRYLAAFGPATVKDVQMWSGLTRLNEVAERLRPRLVTFTAEQGRELFDLPDAPRPDPDTPAPPRFLYDYDNLLLSHHDRTRFTTEEYQQHNFAKSPTTPCIVLVDGLTNGTWRITRQRDTATLTIAPFTTLSSADTEALVDEGARLLCFAAPNTTHDIQITAPG